MRFYVTTSGRCDNCGKEFFVSFYIDSKQITNFCDEILSIIRDGEIPDLDLSFMKSNPPKCKECETPLNITEINFIEELP